MIWPLAPAVPIAARAYAGRCMLPRVALFAGSVRPQGPKPQEVPRRTLKQQRHHAGHQVSGSTRFFAHQCKAGLAEINFTDIQYYM